MPVAVIRGVRAPAAVRGLAALLIGPAVAGAVLVGAGSGAGGGAGTGPLGSAAPAAQARGETAERAGAACRSAVTVLLAERSRAVLTRDRGAFLAGIDPSQPDLRARQARVFDALAAVPLASWAYRLGGAAGDGASCPAGSDGSRDAEGPARWSPPVVLAVALDGLDGAPVEVDQPLGFVRRDGRWYVAEDAGRQLWDTGPVAVVRGRQSLVLGRPAVLPVLRQVAAQTDTAVDRVRASWGPGWSQRVVVLVPGDAAGLADLVPGGRLDGLAAVTLPDQRGSAGRVVLDPVALGRLSEVGRQVVLTHEVTHVATAARPGPACRAGWPRARRPRRLPGLRPAGRTSRGRAGRGGPGRPAAGGAARRRPTSSGAARARRGVRAGLAGVRLLTTSTGRSGSGAVPRPRRAARRRRPARWSRRSVRDLGTSPPALTADWRAGLRRRWREPPRPGRPGLLLVLLAGRPALVAVPWTSLPGADRWSTSPRDFTAAQLAREEAFHDALRPTVVRLAGARASWSPPCSG